MLKHAKPLECKVFLENQCESKFINFNMFRDHIERDHNVDIIGQTVLKTRFSSKMMARTKICSTIASETVIQIIKTFRDEFMTNVNYTSEHQLVNKGIAKRRKKFKNILEKWKLTKTESKYHP